ncbi:MAG: endonuclease III [Clostridium sp.]|nr:endonuclease III [Clostridium sp.]
MTKKDRVLKVIDALKIKYPEAICSLNASNPFELLVAVRLSAQCTDARVNLVTPALFDKYKTLDDYCNADVKDIERLIHSCGFYKSKAVSIIDMAKGVRDRFGGVVPDNIEDLITLNGVGRKTANLIVGDVYGKESIVVDTHMIRISNRIGLVNDKDPKKIEFALKKIVPVEEGSDFCHRIVLFGRDVCSARKPLCDQCPINDVCKKVGVKL